MYWISKHGPLKFAMLFDLSRSLEPLPELLRGRGWCHLTGKNVGTPRWCIALPLGSRAQHRQRVRRQSPGLTAHATRLPQNRFKRQSVLSAAAAEQHHTPESSMVSALLALGRNAWRGLAFAHFKLLTICFKSQCPGTFTK